MSIKFETINTLKSMECKILIVGSGGKSTLSNALSNKFHLVRIELDAIHWQPNWIELSDNEFKTEVAKQIQSAKKKWVVDGNYHGIVGDLIMNQANTIIWIDLNWKTILYRIIKRSIKRAITKEFVCGTNKESFKRTFFTKDSIIWFYFANKKDITSRTGIFLEKIPENTHLIHIKTTKELNDFYKTYAL
jgi:adenylate kinase family enzyme